MNEMTFWDHAEALRKVLLQALAVTACAIALAFAVMPGVFDRVILAPCRPDFPLYDLFDGDFHEVKLINIRLASQFFVHMSASLWLGCLIALPVATSLLWSFIAPALYPDERRGARIAAFGANIMFFAGIATGYFLVFPLTLRFLADYQLSTLIPNQISLDSYIENFFLILLVMGIVFELPVVTWLLGKTGLLHRGVFTDYRRHAIVALLVIAAVITPTGDPFTLLVVFTPIYILWEFSGLTVPKHRKHLITD